MTNRGLPSAAPPQPKVLTADYADPVDEKYCAAPVQLLEPRIELRLTEINIIQTPRRSDAIHLQRVERTTDLSYRVVSAVCSARCLAG
jgi:hypothetical protein